MQMLHWLYWLYWLFFALGSSFWTELRAGGSGGATGLGPLQFQSTVLATANPKLHQRLTNQVDGKTFHFGDSREPTLASIGNRTAMLPAKGSVRPPSKGLLPTNNSRWLIAPSLSICLVADALYCCQAVVVTCKQFDWRYVLTLKEGRQPTTWEETIHLLPLHRTNRLRCLLGLGGKEGRKDFRWVENVMLGEHQTNVILQGEITNEPSATLYAYITNFSNLTPQRVAAVVNSGGRERHLIEDTFNAQKNNGIGLAHVFCANATASKNYYTMMQVAEVLWTLTCHGGLRRLYDWARRATEQGLARALWEGLRTCRLPPDLPPLGQIPFSSA
jgi:hypothetical protein